MSLPKGYRRALVACAIPLAIATLMLTSDAEDEDRQDGLTEAQRRYLLAGDIVFVGEILGLGDQPPHGSGVGIARQGVLYGVEEVLKGSFRLKRIAVHHVVAGGATGHPDRSIPALNPELFKVGRRVIVTASIAEQQPFGPKHYGYLLVNDSDNVGLLDGTKKAIGGAKALLQ